MQFCVGNGPIVGRVSTPGIGGGGTQSKYWWNDDDERVWRRCCARRWQSNDASGAYIVAIAPRIGRAPMLKASSVGTAPLFVRAPTASIVWRRQWSILW